MPSSSASDIARSPASGVRRSWLTHDTSSRRDDSSARSRSRVSASALRRRGELAAHVLELGGERAAVVVGHAVRRRARRSALRSRRLSWASRRAADPAATVAIPPAATLSTMTVIQSSVGSSMAWIAPSSAPIDAAVPVSTTEASTPVSERRRSRQQHEPRGQGGDRRPQQGPADVGERDGHDGGSRR